MNIWRKLAEGGGWTLPFLVKLTAEETGTVRLINDVVALEYEGERYEPSNFTYTPKDDGAAAFSVEVAESTAVFDMMENAENILVEVVGVLNAGEVEPVLKRRHKYGTATWDGAKLEIQLEKDDRLNMTFPALIFSTNNNRGNS